MTPLERIENRRWWAEGRRLGVETHVWWQGLLDERLCPGRRCLSPREANMHEFHEIPERPGEIGTWCPNGDNSHLGVVIMRKIWMTCGTRHPESRYSKGGCPLAHLHRWRRERGLCVCVGWQGRVARSYGYGDTCWQCKKPRKEAVR